MDGFQNLLLSATAPWRYAHNIPPTEPVDDSQSAVITKTEGDLPALTCKAEMHKYPGFGENRRRIDQREQPYTQFLRDATSRRWSLRWIESPPVASKYCTA